MLPAHPPRGLPASPLPSPSSLPFIHSLLFSPFSLLLLPLSGSGPLSFSPSPLLPDVLSAFPPLHSSFLPALSAAPLPSFQRPPPPGFSVRRRAMPPSEPRAQSWDPLTARSQGPQTQRSSRLPPPLKEPPRGSPGRSPRPREPCWPPGRPSCQRRWVYFRFCTQCPRPEDAGTGPATRVTPCQRDPELTQSQLPQRGSGPLARQAGPRWWMAVSVQASRDPSAQGIPGPGAWAPQRKAPLARPPGPGSLGSHLSWKRESQELPQPLSFPSACPGLLNF